MSFYGYLVSPDVNTWSLSSDSDSESSSDSDCVFLYATSGAGCRELVRCGVDLVPTTPFEPSASTLFLESSSVSRMASFAEEVLNEESFYNATTVVDFFRSKMNISATDNEEDVVVAPCSEGERVCDPVSAGSYGGGYYMYMGVLEEFGVKLPLTPFEMDVLKFLNVAPSQIRPNSWAFIRAFEICCKALALEPSVGVFLHFYGTKDVRKGTWISISAHPEKKLFQPYASNFKKEWRDTFARVEGAPKCSTLSVMAGGVPKFPLSWTSLPANVMGYDFEKMTIYEQELVCFLEKFAVMDIHKLLDREGDSAKLDEYLQVMAPISGAARRKYMAEIKAKQAASGYVSSDATGVQLRRVKRKEAPSKADTEAVARDDDNPEGSVEVTATTMQMSPRLKKAKKAGVVEGALSGCQVADSFWHKDFDFRRFMEEKVPLAEVDVEADMKAKFGDLVMDAGMSALRVLLMGNVMEKKHELLEAKYKDVVDDVEKWKHKATGLESRLSAALKEKKTSDKAAEDAKKAHEAAEAEKEKLNTRLAVTQAELEASPGDFALYFDNGFERAKEQVLLFNPDAKLEDLDPFKVIVNGELVEEVEEEVEE